MNYIDFYTSALQCAGAKVNDKGFLSLGFGDEEIPLTIEKKPLALPTRELLAKPSDDVVLFHPASESLIRKESPVFRQLRKLLLLRVNDVSAQVIKHLINFAINTDGHKKATPDQRDFLGLIPEIKPKTVELMEKVLDAMDGKSSNRIVSQTLRSGVKLNEVDYKRVSSITFPLFKNISLEDKKWNGVKFSVKDLRIVHDVAEYLFPDHPVRDEYSTGTHEMQVPNLHCMMSGLLPIYSELNRIIAIFDLDDSLLFDTSYEAGLSKLAKYRALVPVQPGNEGEPLDGEVEEDEEVVSTSGISNAARTAASSTEKVVPSNHPAPAPTGVPAAKVESDEPPWKRVAREKREAEEAITNPQIPNSLSEAQRNALSYPDKVEYDRWYADQIAMRQHELAMAAQHAQGWSGQQGGYQQGGYGQGGYGQQPQGQMGYQQGGYQGGHHQQMMQQAPASARERYEQEQLQRQQYSQGHMRPGRSVRY